MSATTIGAINGRSTHPFTQTAEYREGLTREGKRVFGAVCRGTIGLDGLRDIIGSGNEGRITDEEFDNIVQLSGVVTVPGF